MAATKLQANWAAVSHGSTSITRVTNVSFSQGGSLSSFSADGDHYPTVIVSLQNKPSATVTSSDTAALMGLAPGTVASFSATHKDAKGATGGDVVYVMANAVVENVDTSGSHGQFGTATLSLLGYSSDGVTNPLSFTRA
ncbi:hypothetical protein OJF2_72510 [Aquisphaera giovannonii]|uniref:Uncharacterized protein n=1 Tax=Aquisphaera giovannonii TaxID=406548 RepID=A0A5B9WF07_9BACT|nr:hypothetical protein [Aquisphaera giovannonii]QEH38645.1 hypothetical protein OJF2_72510 [Aquisphaera giovannonii]